MMLGLLVALLAAQAPDAGSAAVANAGFEQVDESGRPTGWLANPARLGDGYSLDTAPGENGSRAGHIARRTDAAAMAPQRAGLMQRIDAAPFRGRIVRLRARLRAVRPGRHVGLALLVRRPPPKIAGFQDSMLERPITSPDWRTYEIRGRVARDAETIEIHVWGSGDAEFLFDDVSLDAVDPDATPPSPEALAYLDVAINHLRRLHIDSRTANWDQIIADAHSEIGGARTPADTYAAIRGVIGALGEKHTLFIPPPPPAASAAPGPGTAAVPPRDMPMPRYRLIDGRFGMLLVPSRIGVPEANGRYQQALRIALETLDRQNVCGWIVDLRFNGGGDMWPMLNGLDPLLGAEPFGSFFAPSGGEPQPWVRRSGAVAPIGDPSGDGPSFRIARAGRPVAILIGPATGSAGEMAAIALIGRPGTRTFGAPTAGYTTANQPVRLSDGAVIALTSGFVRDRLGRDYRDAIVPDAPAANALEAAIAWLSAQRPCRG